MKKKQVKKRTVFTIMYIPRNEKPWPTRNLHNPHFATLKKAIEVLKREKARYDDEDYFILQHEA